ncbi:MAG TPA: molecular chaperone GrpE [Leptolyngbyaceae cyanobacterium M33_DOE_097]|uniref:Molecular chaperone GrpE n=1 Tax=Oscillatoriales cyanobacterium SpSt-418 TaxID=2282169 RepID=A0A7C3KG14_9CYAN|nr:molecular chaperone GrpE [Leptolyngbyaceae cyanobacterium M33_DOE_097]
MLFGFVLFVLISLALLHIAAVADKEQRSHPSGTQRSPHSARSAVVKPAERVDDLQTERRRYEALQHAYEQLQQELAEQKALVEQLQNASLQPPVNESLRQECLRLRRDLDQQQAHLHAEWQYNTFSKLQTLLTNYPSAQKIAQLKPDLPAQNLTALFTPLEHLADDWGWQAIGSVWEQVPYNPQWHQADSEDIHPEEPVYVRFIGYRSGDRILCPAKVSRSLPTLVND